MELLLIVNKIGTEHIFYILNILSTIVVQELQDKTSIELSTTSQSLIFMCLCDVSKLCFKYFTLLKFIVIVEGL